MSERLISADSHVQIPIAAVRERVPEKLREPFDAAIAESAAEDRANARRQGDRRLELGHGGDQGARATATRTPACGDGPRRGRRRGALLRGQRVPALRPDQGRLEADQPGVHRPCWPTSPRVDPNRLAVSYQVPVIDIEYAVSEVQRLAELGARSVHLPNFPSELGLPDYHDRSYDPLWAVPSGDRHPHQPPSRQPLLALGRLPSRPDAAVRHLHVAAEPGPRRGRRVLDPAGHVRAVPRPADRVRRVATSAGCPTTCASSTRRPTAATTSRA